MDVNTGSTGTACGSPCVFDDQKKGPSWRSREGDSECARPEDLGIPMTIPKMSLNPRVSSTSEFKHRCFKDLLLHLISQLVKIVKKLMVTQ